MYYQFNIQNVYVLPTQFIPMFFMDLKTKQNKTNISL